jgi:hypothetical protein
VGRPGVLQIAYGEENFEADYRCVLTSSPHSRDDVITFFNKLFRLALDGWHLIY